MKKFFYKTIITAVLVVIISGSAVLSFPQRAKATGMPVLDIQQLIKEYGLDTLGWMLSKLAIQKLADSTINWINSGFNGRPLFITNFNDFMNDYLNQASGVFLEKFKLTELCDEFRPSLDLIFKYQKPYEIRMKCTLKDVSENITEFYEGNFEQGGWAAWIKTSIEPQNDPWGAYFTSLAEYEKITQEKLNAANQEATAGQGFLGMKVCVDWEDRDKGAPKPAANSEFCRNTQSTTPGALINDRLKKTLGTDIDQLGMADELNEVLAALMKQMINKVFTGISGSSSGGSSGDGGLLNYGTPTYNDLSDDEQLTQEERWGDLKEKIVDLKEKIDDAYVEQVGMSLFNYYKTFEILLVYRECSGDDWSDSGTLYETKDNLRKYKKMGAELRDFVDKIGALEKEVSDNPPASASISFMDWESKMVGWTEDYTNYDAQITEMGDALKESSETRKEWVTKINKISSKCNSSKVTAAITNIQTNYLSSFELVESVEKLFAEIETKFLPFKFPKFNLFRTIKQICGALNLGDNNLTGEGACTSSGGGSGDWVWVPCTPQGYPPESAKSDTQSLWDSIDFHGPSAVGAEKVGTLNNVTIDSNSWSITVNADIPWPGVGNASCTFGGECALIHFFKWNNATGKWDGGKFDWWREGATTKSLENVAQGYGDLRPGCSGEVVAFALTNSFMDPVVASLTTGVTKRTNLFITTWPVAGQ